MIKLDSIRFRYHKHSTPISFDLHITHGAKVAIIGASGAGKSTLLNLIAGFAVPERGEIWLNGENHTRTLPYQRPVSMLFQDNNLFNHLSVEQNIGLGIVPNLKLTDKHRDDIKHIAEQVGLADYLSRLPDTLSGGQQQRVALARCLLRDKPILLLDEPFSALDKALRMEILNLLNKLCEKKQLTVLLVTHQVEEMTTFTNRIINIQP